jgi:hypothetical protein
MKDKIKNLLMLTILTALSSYQTMVKADNSPPQSLGAALSATDLFQVTCAVGASNVYAAVSDSGGTNRLNLQIYKSLKALSTTDNTAVGTLSPAITLSGTTGAGVYYIMVNKNVATAINYSFVYHCQTAAGAHLPAGGTALGNVQNQ